MNNFMVIFKVIKINHKVFLYVLHLQITGKIGQLLKHACSENHTKAVALNEFFLPGKNEPLHTLMVQ